MRAFLTTSSWEVAERFCSIVFEFYDGNLPDSYCTVFEREIVNVDKL